MRFPHGVEAEIWEKQRIAEVWLNQAESIQALIRGCIDLSILHKSKTGDYCNCEICHIVAENPELKSLLGTV